jgi:hypothetical protein
MGSLFHLYLSATDILGSVIAKCGIALYINICWQQTKSENNSGGATPLHDW